jgi:Cu(I)/Ag(I) efflux system membrane protein CusA/SilA
MLHAPREADWDDLINIATMKALERFDETMRTLALLRYREIERDLSPVLTRFAVRETVRRFREAGDLEWPPRVNAEAEVNRLVKTLTPEHGPWLANNPAQEEVARLCQEVARRLHAVRSPTNPNLRALADPSEALAFQEGLLRGVVNDVSELLGAAPTTFAGEVLRAVEKERLRFWHERVQKVNWELLDRGVEAYTWLAIEELAKGAKNAGLLGGARHGAETRKLLEEAVKAQLGKKDFTAADRNVQRPFAELRSELEKPFADRVFLWPRQSGPKGDLVDDEFGRVLQVPGWSNIFTQPIINRIEMLSTGVRTDIGVKVFGPDLPTIEGVCKQIEAALKPINGARDVVAAQVSGKPYLEIDIDRAKAARYGVSVDDIQNTIEVALGGRIITYTVEKRDRFPVRIRYARAQREDEETVKRLLVSGSGTSGGAAMKGTPSGTMATPGMAGADRSAPAEGVGRHRAASLHAPEGQAVQIPLSALAKVRIIDGPAMFKSENGRQLNYVTLNVRGRDIVGFVDEAKRVVDEKIRLPEGVHIEWSGEFEHQLRAAKTLRFVFPAVIVLIFIILFLTYADLADAGLMMLAVPEALAGGIFFQFFFPKIMHGWSAPPLDFSVAVWVGYIACFGMATETGIIMLVYLREAIEKRGGLANIKSLEELRQAVIEGAVHRLRPKLLTEGVAIIALAPMLFTTGVGGEIIAPMAVPVLGGLLIADEVVDIFLPVRFYWVRRARWLKLRQLGTGNAQEQGESNLGAAGNELPNTWVVSQQTSGLLHNHSAGQTKETDLSTGKQAPSPVE